MAKPKRNATSEMVDSSKQSQNRSDLSNKRQKRNESHANTKNDDPSKMPKKKFFRQRAHANPFSDHALN